MRKIIVFLISTLCYCLSVFSENHEIWFKSLSLEDGLSESTVQCIIQDRKGLMWMGTRDGLNRFNGYEFTAYNYNERDPYSISSNFINCLFEDSEGRIWVGTNSNGVSFYNYDTDDFRRIHTPEDFHYSLSNTTVWDILGDKNGNIWIATMDGLFRYCMRQEKITDHYRTSTNPGSISDNNIRTLALDSAGNLWLGTDDGGVCQMNSAGNSFMCFKKVPDDPNSLSSNHIRKLYFQSDSILWIGTIGGGFNKLNILTFRNQRYSFKDRYQDDPESDPVITGFASADDQKLWISTENKGLKLFNPVDGSFKTYEYTSYSSNTISSNSITGLYKDKDGIIWAGAMGFGVNYFFPNKYGVKRFQHVPFDPSSISNNIVRCFFEQDNGNIWIGTDGGGIDIFNAQMQKVGELNKKTPGAHFNSNVALSIQSDTKGNIWIATWGDGVLKYSTKNQTYRRFIHNPNNPQSLSSNFISSLTVDEHDNLWVSCFKEGLNKLEAGSSVFEKIQLTDDVLYEKASYYITRTLIDSKSNFWISSFDGLFLRKGNVTMAFIHDMNDTTSISSNIVHYIYEDSKGRIWIGTNNKLNLYDPDKRIFHKYGDREEFPSRVIYSIVEDDAGFLWLSTNKGIVRFDPDLHDVKKYNIHHGLQNTQFNSGSTLKLSGGELLFGGISGFNLINPANKDWVKDNPKVLLTNLYLFNKIQTPGKETSPLSKHISKIDELVFNHTDKVITLEFVGLNYFSPGHTEYAYRLVGFEKDWNYVGMDRQATYTNLNHGKYTFEVMAKETDQDWMNEVTRINITILPPFWKTDLAMVSYIFIIFLLILFLRIFILKKERVKMQDKFERYRHKKASEMEALRIRFFTNISHDLRTPLTLILAPFEKLLKNEPDEEKRYQISVIQKNALRLERLINQLLDLRKQENSSLKLSVHNGDLFEFLTQIVESFKDLAEQKNISLNLESELNSLYMLFDHDKLDRIMFNLLSNAFKFTLEGGKVTVRVSKTDSIPEANHKQQNNCTKYVCINVVDTGKGIPAELHEKVFERFYHITDTFYTGIEGTGIGLSLSKDYVELHGGRILLESQPGVGSRFMVYIPLRSFNEPSSIEGLPGNDDEDFDDENCLQSNPITSEKPVALIVEDNFELREYIKNSLSKDFTLITEENGEDGLNKAFEMIPDIIITDIMMPKLDGIELTRILKSDLRTSHIPIILLTARTSDNHKLEGLNVGADDYITKPFSFELLEARMLNLLQLREHIREKYSKLIKLQPTEIEVENQDEKFIRKVMQIVEDHISDSEFSVEKLSSELGLSRVHLYRKLNALINETPVEFIRNTRLDRAAQLLKKSKMNISEVCYEVGFMNPVYFSKCFKKKFGILPSEFIVRESA